MLMKQSFCVWFICFVSMLGYFVSIPPNLKYIDATDSPVIMGTTNGFVIINNKVKPCVFLFAGHSCYGMSVWQCNWHTKDPVDSNTCRNWYFLAANVLLFIRQRAIEDYKPKAAVCVVFLTISHWALSSVLLYIFAFTLSRSHCIRIYHISYEVAQH